MFISKFSKKDRKFRQDSSKVKKGRREKRIERTRR